ncbi:MAG: hypothetical protein IJK18_04380 [Clostridia bacterium]|nr:hypothetical protein [Clostridia bacterium]
MEEIQYIEDIQDLTIKALLDAYLDDYEDTYRKQRDEIIVIDDKQKLQELLVDLIKTA